MEENLQSQKFKKRVFVAQNVAFTNVVEDYVENVQKIIIERIKETTEENKHIKSRKHNFFSSREIFSDYFEELQFKKDFCDVTLACEDKQFNAHKEMISSTSTVLNLDYKVQSTVILLEMQDKISEEIFNNVSEELFNELSEELYSEITDKCFEDVSKKICQEVSEEMCDDVAAELYNKARPVNFCHFLI